MSLKTGLSLVALALLATIFLWLWRMPASNTTPTRGVGSESPSSLRAATEPSPRLPGAPANAETASATQARPAAGAARERMLATDDLMGELARLEADPNIPLADKLFYRALVFETCSGYKEAVRSGPPEAASAVKDGTLDRLIALVMGGVKDERQKVAMQYNLKRKVWNACRGFANAGISPAEIEKAYAAAAAAGNPAAVARMINARLAESGAQNADKVPQADQRLTAGAQGPVGYPDPITSDEQRRLLDAMFSGDPVAIRAAGNVLSTNTDRQSLRFGPEQVDLGIHTDAIWALAACEFGYECGPRNLAVNLACAEQRRCADDLASYLRDFAMTPSEFATVQANAHAIADAIRRRDFSAFQLVPQPGSVRVLLGNPPPRVEIR